MELKISTCIAAGDYEQALRLMAKTYSTQIGRFCAGFAGSEADGDDLLQETFVDAWKAMGRYEGNASPKAWLFGVARRVCIRYLRKRDRRSDLIKRWFGKAKDPVSREPSAERRVQETESRTLVEQALLQLKPILREAVLLYYQAGLSTPEMADCLGVKPAAARKRVSLGIRDLRRILRPLLMEPPSNGDLTTEEKENEPKVTMSESRGPRLVGS